MDIKTKKYLKKHTTNITAKQLEEQLTKINIAINIYSQFSK